MEYRSGGTIREGSLKSHGLNLPQEFGEYAAPLPNNGSLELGEDSAHVKHGLASGRSVWKRAGFLSTWIVTPRLELETKSCCAKPACRNESPSPLPCCPSHSL